MSLNGTSTSGRLTSPSSATRHNSSSNQNFQFEFPNFGGLPGSQHFGSNSRGQLRANNESPGSSSSGAIPYSVPGIMERGSFGNTSPKANIQQNKADGNPSSSNGTSVTPWSPSAAADTNAAADLTSLFSPSILRNVSRSASRDYVSHNSSNNAAGDISRRSTENPSGQHSVPQLVGGSTSSDSTSPSASSVSQHGPGSSCGTSPEPSNYSPVNVKTGEYSLNTINEEHLHKGNLEGRTTKSLYIASIHDLTFHQLQQVL